MSSLGVVPKQKKLGRVHYISVGDKINIDVLVYFENFGRSGYIFQLVRSVLILDKNSYAP